MNPPSSNIGHPSRSGRDLDIWGGEPTKPAAIPRPGEPGGCPLAVDGKCPEGCRDCTDFERDYEFMRLERSADVGPP